MSNEEEKIKVLFADDDLYVLHLLGRGADDRNFDYKLAEDGGAVLELLTKEQFDVVCFDIKMPIMYGTTLAASMRELDMSTPIIFFTNYIGTEIRGAAKEYNVNIVEKSEDIMELMNLIEQLADSRPKYKGPERRKTDSVTRFTRRMIDKQLALPKAFKEIALAIGVRNLS